MGTSKVKASLFAGASAILIGMALAPAGIFAAPSAPSLDERSPEITECPTRIGAFRQTDVWYRGQNRILIEADSACGSPYGDALDLHNVRLSILSGNRTYAILRSPVGAYDRSGHQLLLGPTERAQDVGCLRGVAALMINLKTGELRAPGHRLELASREMLPACEHAVEPEGAKQ